MVWIRLAEYKAEIGEPREAGKTPKDFEDPDGKIEKGIKTNFEWWMEGKPGFFPCKRSRINDQEHVKRVDDGSMVLEEGQVKNAHKKLVDKKAKELHKVNKDVQTFDQMKKATQNYRIEEKKKRDAESAAAAPPTPAIPQVGHDSEEECSEDEDSVQSQITNPKVGAPQVDGPRTFPNIEISLPKFLMT